MDNHRWAEKETQRLIAAGVNPLDAQRSTSWTLAHLPQGADPATWVPTVFDIVERLDKAAELDAMTVFFQNNPANVRRLLSAGAK